MSHFCVAVFTNEANFFQTIIRLLEPYDENNSKFYTFHEKPYKQIKEEYENFKKQNPSWTFDMYVNEFGYKKEGFRWGIWYNDNARYDYYSIDSRCDYEDSLTKNGEKYHEGCYRFRKDQLKVTENSMIPYAFLTQDGVWHAPGIVGWFGCSTETDEQFEEYKKEFEEYLKTEPIEYVSFVDCHI